MLDLELNDFAKNYLLLGLRIGKHINGYVEHYYGPPEIKYLVDSETLKSPNNLLKDCYNLINQISNQGFQEKRIIYFNKTLRAMNTILRKLKGESIPYLTLVENLYDFEPIYYKEDYFYSLTSEANEIFKGEGNLHKRMNEYAIKRIIPQEKLKELFLKAINIAKKKTMEKFPYLLPKTEKIKINLVKNKSWGMYNWYQGNYQSIIEINTSNDIYWTNLLNSACHEGYPGHHTECIIKDKFLLRKKKYFENCIKMIYTPEMVISEGIAQIAEKVLFQPEISVKLSIENFCLNPEIENDLDSLIKQKILKSKFSVLEGNLAYCKYVFNWNDDKIKEFLKDLGIIPETGIDSLLKFISDELWIPYILIYQGERLLIEKFGNHPNPKTFQSIYLEYTLPSDLI